MQVYAQDSLFQPSPAQPQTQVVTQTTTSSTAFDPLAFLADGKGMESFIIQLNYFTLAWCIFYSVLFVADFFFCRMYHADGELPKEKLGVESIFRASYIWLTYLVCWVFLVLYSFFPNIFGAITILVYFWKLLSRDLPDIFDIIHNYVSFSGVFTTFRSVTGPFRKLLRLNFKK